MVDVVIEHVVDVVVERAEGAVAVVTEALQGPPGPPGPPGAGGVGGAALLTSNRLSEFAADPAAQEDAQANLGLGADPLAYYILAKA